MENHYILCGLGRVGWRVLEYLQATGTPIVVVDNRCAPEDPRLAKVKVVIGDCRKQEVLEKAGLARARGVLIVPSDDLVCISTALMARHLNPSVRIVVRVFNQNLITRLGNAVANTYALSTSALAAPLLALIARTGEALGTFRLENGTRQQIAELTIRSHMPLASQTLTEVMARYPIQVIAHMPARGGKHLIHEVNPHAQLLAGDRLVVCGETAHLAPLLAQEENISLPELLWAGYVRRMARVAWRTLREIDLAVKICTTLLVGLIVCSSLVFHYAHNDTPVDAFYRTISLIATGAEMGGSEFEKGGWQKAFVSMLRLSGMALVAAFTAIITNYLVRAHLGGALEVRRIPEKGHIIVCGLGNVGFRVVEELIHQGERVVVIERGRDNAFIATARRAGVAVINGDATVEEVLKQAHAGTAKAVVAATSNELVNLEVALLVRELNVRTRIVLRLTDPHLAQTLREAADVRLALSIPELAAPAFVAALFGDRVHNVFLIGGRLLAALDLVVQTGDGFLDGHSVRALAVDYRLVPLALLRERGQLPPLEEKLQAGDRLTVIMTLSDLQRLLQREQVPQDCAVEVVEIPPTARAYMAKLLASIQSLNAETAEKSLDQLPVCLRTRLTRGQAEDLLQLLRREQVAGRIQREQV